MIIHFTHSTSVIVRKPITYVKLGTPGKRRWHLVYTVKGKEHRVPVREVVSVRPGVKL